MKIGLPRNDVRTFYEVNKASFKDIANPFVNRLITANIIERDWASHANFHRLNPERAKSLESITTLDGFTTLEFVETISDADLRSRCEATVLRNEFADSLLREALTVLEDRLRNLLPDSHEGRVDRRNVPGLVLSPDKGYSPVGKDAATQRDFMMLVSGMVGLWSEVHHSLIDVDPSAVRRVIGMIDVILEMLT